MKQYQAYQLFPPTIEEWQEANSKDSSCINNIQMYTYRPVYKYVHVHCITHYDCVHVHVHVHTYTYNIPHTVHTCTCIYNVHAYIHVHCRLTYSTCIYVHVHVYYILCIILEGYLSICMSSTCISVLGSLNRKCIDTHVSIDTLYIVNPTCVCACVCSCSTCTCKIYITHTHTHTHTHTNAKNATAAAMWPRAPGKARLPVH